MDSDDSVPPPPPPKMKASDLPEIGDEWESAPAKPPGEVEPLPGYTITTSDSELSTLPPTQLFELNQAALQDAEQSPDIPLMGPLTKLDDLREEYIRGNQTFVKQINYLVDQGFLGIRRTRGDGDCFYRSFAFAYIERLLKTPEASRAAVVQAALKQVEQTSKLLQGVGYETLVYEDFYDALVHMIKRIVNAAPDAPQLTQRGLLEAFNDAPTSNSIMMYMRYVTSAQIKAEPMNYMPYLFNPDQPWLEDPMDPGDFCNLFVDPMGKEADEVQIVALSTAFRATIRVAYLDGHEPPVPPGRPAAAAATAAGRETSEVKFHTFENGDEGALEPLTLLYRPGHYDVLSRMSEDPQEGLF